MAAAQNRRALRSGDSDTGEPRKIILNLDETCSCLLLLMHKHDHLAP